MEKLKEVFTYYALLLQVRIMEGWTKFCDYCEKLINTKKTNSNGQ